MDKGTDSDEIVKLKVKPNAFLYALEATRIYFLIVLCAAAVLVVCIHMVRGLPMAFLTLLALTISCVLFLIFFLVVILRALGMAFVITDKRAIACLSVMGRTIYQSSIPINSIRSIEVRRYGGQYGSIYLERQKAPRSDVSNKSEFTQLSPAVDRLRSPADLRVKPGWSPIWLSVPLSSPPLTGFYGFRHFDTFAKMIVELQAAS